MLKPSPMQPQPPHSFNTVAGYFGVTSEHQSYELKTIKPLGRLAAMLFRRQPVEETSLVDAASNVLSNLPTTPETPQPLSNKSHRNRLRRIGRYPAAITVATVGLLAIGIANPEHQSTLEASPQADIALSSKENYSQETETSQPAINNNESEIDTAHSQPIRTNPAESPRTSEMTANLGITPEINDGRLVGHMSIVSNNLSDPIEMDVFLPTGKVEAGSDNPSLAKGFMLFNPTQEYREFGMGLPGEEGKHTEVITHRTKGEDSLKEADKLEAGDKMKFTFYDVVSKNYKVITYALAETPFTYEINSPDTYRITYGDKIDKPELNTPTLAISTCTFPFSEDHRLGLTFVQESIELLDLSGLNKISPTA
jgi:hypothetical protein